MSEPKSEGTSGTSEADFVSQTVRKSLPSRTRPRLRTDAEDRLAEVEEKSAACYAGLETMTEQLNKLARDIETHVESEEPIPTPEIFEGEDSLVQSINDFRTAAKR